MINNETEPYWFARRNGAVRGPFTVDHVKHWIRLGRIRLSDEVSQDECSWRPVMELPDLFPDELAGASGPEDYQRFLAAYSHADERVNERRRGNGKLPSTVRTERRRGPDRRISNWLVGFVQLNKSRSGNLRKTHSLRILLLATLIASLVLAYFSTSSR
ncbi:MAG: hypothetical protein HKM88_05150 [Halobacteria archaeon]|nr:hypothetical protein [Halobacteria archaeon]